ncbi:MAG: hypothetical protein ACXAEU_10615 [Candidatus Hodarchaeales archaeon]
MSLDKFFSGDKKKKDKEKTQNSKNRADIHDIPDNELIQPVTPVNEEITDKQDLSRDLIPEKGDDELPAILRMVNHKWEVDWLDNVTKEELYYMLKETVEANRRFHHLKKYIEKQMVLKGSLDSTEMAIKLNLTEGEILILFDSIYTSIKKER